MKKKNIFKSVLALTVISMLSSCVAFHSGYMSNSASLSSANFTYVKQSIKGQATATYFLVFGGLGKETLVDNAKQQMLASNPLKSNQALVNQTVNFKFSILAAGLISTVTCTVTADVVEFN